VAEQIASGERTATRINELWRALSGKPARTSVSLLDQGADSLLLVALLGEIEDELGVHIEADELLENPSIDALATIVCARS
jgi:acyl carrier protein